MSDSESEYYDYDDGQEDENYEELMQDIQTLPDYDSDQDPDNPSDSYEALMAEIDELSSDSEDYC